MIAGAKEATVAKRVLRWSNVVSDTNLNILYWRMVLLLWFS